MFKLRSLIAPDWPSYVPGLLLCLAFAFVAMNVDHLLGSEAYRRRTGRAVGSGFGFVHDHVVAIDLPVGDIVGAKDHVGGSTDERSGVGAGLIVKLCLCCCDPAIVRGGEDIPSGVCGHGRGRERAALRIEELQVS